MEFHVNGTKGKFAKLFVDGELKAEIGLEKAQTVRGWERELAEARASVNALRFFRQAVEDVDTDWQDHNHKSDKGKWADYSEGFRAGLLNVAAEHPEDVPRVPPKSTPSYRRGYELGQAIYRALKTLEKT